MAVSAARSWSLINTLVSSPRFLQGSGTGIHRRHETKRLMRVGWRLLHDYVAWAAFPRGNWWQWIAIFTFLVFPLQAARRVMCQHAAPPAFPLGHFLLILPRFCFSCSIRSLLVWASPKTCFLFFYFFRFRNSTCIVLDISSAFTQKRFPQCSFRYYI